MARPLSNLQPYNTTLLPSADRKNKVPRDQLHTCHFRDRRTKTGVVAVTDQDLPDLPNYFNNNDENHRLVNAKERCMPAI